MSREDISGTLHTYAMSVMTCLDLIGKLDDLIQEIKIIKKELKKENK